MKFPLQSRVPVSPFFSYDISDRDNMIGRAKNRPFQEQIIRLCPTTRPARIAIKGIAKIRDPFDSIASLKRPCSEVSGQGRRSGDDSLKRPPGHSFLSGLDRMGNPFQPLIVWRYSLCKPG